MALSLDKRVNPTKAYIKLGKDIYEINLKGGEGKSSYVNLFLMFYWAEVKFKKLKRIYLRKVKLYMFYGGVIFAETALKTTDIYT